MMQTLIKKDYYSYEDLINSFGHEVLLQKDSGDYQGDSWFLLKNGDQYGLLTFGWGSCSGCDALQACDSYKEVVELQSELWNSIQWFDNKEATLFYLRTKDFSLEWSPEDHIAFQKEAIAILEKE